jgi:DNA-binding transcriptional ArsR family regulator
MRPTAQPQSALRTPLNDILGTEANVRLLRVLSERTMPATAAELARQSELQPSTVHRALKMLELAGIAEFSGATISLRNSSPLAEPLRQLFAHERERQGAVMDGLIRIGRSLRRPPIAMWVEGPVARGTDRPGDPVILVVVDNPGEVDRTRETVARAAERIEASQDVTIEVRGRTLADLEASPGQLPAGPGTAIPLTGVTPEGLIARGSPGPEQRRRIVSHADLDSNALAMGRAVATALLRDPALVERARSRLDKRWQVASVRERKELDEWRAILRTSSGARLRRIIADTGERSVRLRQTLPFLGILSAAELRAIRSGKK